MTDFGIFKGNIYVSKDKYVTSIAFHQKFPIMANSCTDNTVKLWGVLRHSFFAICFATLKEHNHSVNCVAFHPTEPIIATGSSDKTIKLFIISNDQFKNNLPTNSFSAVHFLNKSRVEKQVFASNDNSYIFLAITIFLGFNYGNYYDKFLIYNMEYVEIRSMLILLP